MTDRTQGDDRRWIELVSDPIESNTLIEFVRRTDSGAIVLFLGTVREFTQGRRTLWLDYEAYPEMALTQMRELANEAFSRWPLSRLAIVHRLGRLELTETSIAIAVSSPHRKEAYEASEFLIDELKVRVPIWKREHWDDGTVEWVHPGTSLPPQG
jgi:molybdopterin synthase catalytic subunit